VLTNITKCPYQVFYVWLADLNIICAKYELETWFYPNDDNRKLLHGMKHGWTKNAFWDAKNMKWSKWLSLFHLPYLVKHMAYLCSQRTPNVQFKCFMFDWSIYRLLVLNTGWKSDSLQIIFVNVCMTWDMFELKTRFGTSITRNDVNGVN
jgi:hypothetical protein